MSLKLAIAKLSAAAAGVALLQGGAVRMAEPMNTDAPDFLGSGVGNLGRVEASADGWHGQPASALLRLPPLGTVWLASSPPS